MVKVIHRRYTQAVKTVDNARQHAAHERKVIHMIDRGSTLHSAARAASVALALAMMLMGVLCHSLAASPAAAVNLLDIRSYTAKIINNSKEFKCLDYIATKESRWNNLADNKRSTAFGIFQMLGERSKDPYKQLERVLRYIDHRYAGSWCKAKSWHVAKGWY